MLSATCGDGGMHQAREDRLLSAEPRRSVNCLLHLIVHYGTTTQRRNDRINTAAGPAERAELHQCVTQHGKTGD